MAGKIRIINPYTGYDSEEEKKKKISESPKSQPVGSTNRELDRLRTNARNFAEYTRMRKQQEVDDGMKSAADRLLQRYDLSRPGTLPVSGRMLGTPEPESRKPLYTNKAKMTDYLSPQARRFVQNNFPDMYAAGGLPTQSDVDKLIEAGENPRLGKAFGKLEGNFDKSRTKAANINLEEADKRRQQEREAAQDRRSTYGMRQIGNSAAYVMPGSPLPDPEKQDLSGRAAEPWKYGIAPQEYASAMSSFDKYNEMNIMPEVDSEAQEFLNRFFDGKLPTNEEFNEKYNQLLNDTTVPDADVKFFFENGADIVGRIAPQRQINAEEYEEVIKDRDKAIELLGEDAEAYTTGNKRDYYERYGQQQGAEEMVAAGKADEYRNYGTNEGITLDEARKYSASPYAGPRAGYDLQRWSQTTQQERDAYALMLETYGEEAANEYLKSIEPELNQRLAGAVTEDAEAYAQEHPVLSSMKTIATAPIRGTGMAEQLWNAATGKEVDPYAPGMNLSREADTIRGTVGDSLGGVGGFLYGTGMSIMDNLANQAMWGGLGSVATLGSMGLSSAGSTYNDVIDRNGTQEQAMTAALVSGVAEGLFEKFSLDNFVELAKGGGAKNVVLNVLKQMGVEGSEETATSIANLIADNLIMGEMSNFNANVDAYMEQGMSEEEARRAAGIDVAKEIGLSAAGGALSGGIMGGFGEVLSADQRRNVKKELEAAAAERAESEQNPPTISDAAMDAAKQPIPSETTQTRDVRAELEQEYMQTGEQQENAPQAAQEPQQQGETVQDEEVEGEQKSPEKTPKKGKSTEAFKQAQTATIETEEGSRAVRVVGVDSVGENGRVMLEVENENGQREVVDGANVMFDNAETEELLAYDAEKLDAKGLRMYLEDYDSSLADAEDYARAFSAVYNRARGGVDYEQAALGNDNARQYLTQDAMIDAFAAGQNVYNQMHNTVQPAAVEAGQQTTAPAQAQLSAKEATKYAKVSRRYTQQAFTNLGDAGRKNAIAQMELLGAIASRTKRTITIVDTIVGKDGQHANAMYNPRTGEIRVALDATEGAYAYAAMHELTHALKNEHKSEWSGFVGFVKGALSDGNQNWDGLVQYQMDQFGYTREQAEEEVVCNTVPALLQDERNVLKLYKGNRTLFDRVVDWVKGLLKDVKNAGTQLSKRSKSWSQMDALANDRKTLQEMYDRLMTVMENEGEDVADTDVVKIDKGYKYSLAPGGKLANNGIERDMPDAERAEVLRNMEIQVVPMVELSPEAQALVDRLGKGHMGINEIQKAIKKLPEYKAIQGVDLHSDSITVPFRFSNDSLQETVTKMIGTDGKFDFRQAQRFVELLGNFSEHVKHANAIELHTDRYLNRSKDYTSIENFGILFGIAQNGDVEVPVMYEVKNYRTNDKDKLYLVATFGEVKKGTVPGLQHYDNQNADPSNTVYSYILSEFIPNINSQNRKLLKYFPNEMLNDAQIQSAEIARLEEERYILKKIGVGEIDLKDGKPVKQSQIDEIDRQIAELRNGNIKFSMRDEQTTTPAFKRWFGNSKIVNEDGSPKVMYRGGGEEINVFDRKKSKASNLYGRGFYFTDSETHAKQYGEARSYYLRVENPLSAESGVQNITQKQMRAFLEAVAEDEDYGLENYGYGASVDSVLKEMKGKPDFDALQDINATAIGDFVAAIELFNEINGTNYDGIITPTETVVFDSRQIKSATNNVGTYDPDNPDIRYSMQDSEGNELTEEQAEYFAESKVRDDEGNLMPMYHGTTAYGEITKFKAGKKGWLGPGIYLTNRKADAQRYADAMGPGNGQLYTLYADVKNPLYVYESDPVPEIMRAAYGNDRTYKARAAKQTNAPNILTNADIKKLKDKGYDGIIWKFYKSVEVNVFTPKQVKSTNNQSPTSADDIRYSLRDTDENVQRAMTAEEKAFELIKTHRITAAEADKLAGEMLKNVNSTYDRQKLAAEISRTFNYAETGEEVDMAQINDEMTALAARVMEKSRTLDLEHEEAAKPVRDYLRTTRVRLTAAQRKEAANLVGSYREYSKALFGRVRLNSTAGTTLDSLWSELNSMAPQWFPEDATEGDMAGLLMQAVDATKPVYHTGMGMNMEESANWLAGKLAEQYFALPAVKAAAADAKTFGDSVRALKAAMTRFEDVSWSEFMHAQQELKAARTHEQRTQKQQEVAALRAKYRQWRERDTAQRKEREMRNRYTGRIEQTAKTILNWMDKPTDAKHIPAGLHDTLARMLASLDFTGKDKKISRELADRLDKLADVMKEYQEGENESRDFFLERDQQLIDEIKRVAELIRGNSSYQGAVEGRGIYDLTGMELKELSKWLDAIRHNIMEASKLRGSNLEGYESVDQAAQMSMAEMSSKKPYKDKKGIVKAWNEHFGPDMQDSFSFFERLGKTAQDVFNGLRSGFDAMVGFTQQAEQHTKTLLEGVKLNELTGKKAKKYTFDLQKGGRVEMTKAQIMELYVLSRREQAQGHIYGGGIRVAGDEDVRPKLMTKADVKAITDTLSKKEKWIAEGLQKFLSRECAAWGNATSTKLVGYAKFGEENYWPIKTDSNERNTTNLDNNYAADINAIKNQGMTKQTKEGASNAIVVGDIFDTYTRHISNMAAYSAYAIPLSDFSRWYNSRGVKTEIEQLMGKKGLEYINNFLMAVNGTGLQDPASGLGKLAGKMSRNAKFAAVGANFRVVIQQPTSYARAAMYMSPKYLSQALTMKKPDAELVNKYCGIAQWKRWGFYETNIGPNLRQMLVGDQSAADKLREKATMLAAMGDDWTLNHLWNACELEVQAETEYKKGSEEYYQQVGKRMSEIIDRTQVVDSVFHRSQMMRSKNAWNQMLTNFMGEPTKTFNMLMSAISDYAADRKNKAARNRLARAITTYAVTGVLTAAAAAIVDAIRDEDADKEWAEKYLDALGSNAIDNLNPAGLLPGVKDILSLLQGYEPSRLDQQSIQRIVWAAQEVNKYVNGESKQNLYGVSYKVAQAVSSLLGIPASNLMRDLNAIAQSVTGVTPTLTAEARSGQTLSHLFNAMTDGDKKRADKLRADLREKAGMTPKEIDTAISKKLAEDQRIKDAWAAKSEKRFADLNRIKNSLTVNGFSSETVDKAINTYGNSVTEKKAREKNPDEELKVTLYTEAEVVSAVRMLCGVEKGGTITRDDVKAMISERIAGSSAKEPEKSVKSDIQAELKKDYLDAENKGNTAAMTRIGGIMKDLLGTKESVMQDWVKEQHGDNLRSAVDANNSRAALKAVEQMRKDGKTDSTIKSALSKYKQIYIDAVNRGDRATASKIKSMLMGLGLTGKNGKALYTDETFEDWLK